MDLMLLLTIIFGAFTVIGVGLAVWGIVIGIKALYKKMHPRELAEKHYKEVFKKDLCPKCGGKNIEWKDEFDGATAWWRGFCRECGHGWEMDWDEHK